VSIEDAEKMTKLLKKRPKKALIIIIALLILAIVGALIYGFFGEIGKQLAGPPQEIRGVSPPPKAEQQQMESTDQPRDKGQGLSTPPKVVQQQKEKTDQPDVSPKINQHTEGNGSPTVVQQPGGDQSPAVYVGPGGSSTITYGAPKDKKSEE
jgi:hypothetical protein